MPPSPSPLLLAWSTDGHLLAWSDAQRTHVWNVDTKREVLRRDGAATVGAFAPSGTTLALATGSPARVEIVTLADQTARTLTTLPAAFRPDVVAWSDDARVVAIGGHDLDASIGQVFVLDAESGAVIGPTLSGFNGANMRMLLNSRKMIALRVDGTVGSATVTAVARGGDDTLIEWDATTGAIVRHIASPSDVVSELELVVAVTPDLSTVATASAADGLLRLHPIGDPTVLGEPFVGALRYSSGLAGDVVEVGSTAFAGADASLLLAGGVDGDVREFERTPVTPLLGHGRAVDLPASLETGVVLPSPGWVVSVAGKQLALLEVGTGRVRRFSLDFDAGTNSTGVLSADTSTVAISDPVSGVVRIVDARTGATRATLDTDGGSYAQVALTSSGDHIAISVSDLVSGASMGKVRVFDADLRDPAPHPAEARRHRRPGGVGRLRRREHDRRERPDGRSPTNTRLGCGDRPRARAVGPLGQGPQPTCRAAERISGGHARFGRADGDLP